MQELSHCLAVGCSRVASMLADTPDEAVEVLESVLMECTAYQVAGQPLSKADSEQLENEITEAVLAVSLYKRLQNAC